MKKCKDCGVKKPETEFYGVQGECKDCTIARVREYQKANAEKVRTYDRGRANLPHRVEARKKYAKSPQGRARGAASNKRQRKKNPKRFRAGVAVGRAVRSGKLTKQPCEVCGSNKIVEGHHDDYDKPLEVRWLCQKHHRQIHKDPF
jgi:hypothetical protein